MRLGVTPVPIPNTMVKTYAADGTLLETVRESRWLPDWKIKSLTLSNDYIFQPFVGEDDELPWEKTGFTSDQRAEKIQLSDGW